eukprot:TRINITY_DN14261_c0_g1_i1.p1 TRINITY_DN14261_c0_g1~~TRINITY_DN14261_c0_g1_i1.p1  ORF type:complete len:537 (+),score=88.66 TRINITY_DN14261_c0_g1_i1:41-1612(+)
MACACTHGIRFVTQTTVCLDVVYDLLGKNKKKSITNGDRADGGVDDDARSKDPLLMYEHANDEDEEGHLEDGSAIIRKKKRDNNGNIGKKQNKGQSNGLIFLCFFLGGVALNMTWNAFAFIVPYWLLHYDANIWRDFVVCYNAPGFPILIIQLLTDEKIAKKFGTRNSYLIRLGITFLLVAVLAGVIPLTQKGQSFDRTGMLIFTTLVGIAVCSGHGWVYSIASYYPQQAVAYLAAGGGAATILLIGLTLALRYPDDESVMQLFTYCEPVFAVALLGTVFLLAMLFTPKSNEILSRVDSEICGVLPTLGSINPSHGGMMSLGGHGDDDSDVPSSSDSSLSGVYDAGQDHMLKEKTPNPLETPGPILKYIWSPVISIFLLLFSIVAAVALVPTIPSASGDPKFPSYILYIGSVFGFIGNELAVYVKVMNGKVALLVFSVLRFLMLPFFLFYSTTRFWLSDIFILCVLGVFGATGAFGVSKAYTICSQSVSVSRQASASNYLNIALYIGVYFGLAVPYLMPYIQL